MELMPEHRERLRDLHKRVAWGRFAVFAGLETIEGRGEPAYNVHLAPAKFRNLSGSGAKPHAVTITIPWETVLACKTDQEYIDLLETEIAIARVRE